MKPIVVVGGGGHAKVLISVLKKMKTFEIIGYTDPVNQGALLGVEYLGDDTILEQIRQQYQLCVATIGLGMVTISETRKALRATVERLGFPLPVIISPHAIVNEDVRIGNATVVLDGAVVNSGAIIGAGVIINTNSTIEHDCHIGNEVHITPGVTLSGSVTIGENCLIGAGTTIIQGITIASNCLIGAGATVVHDCLESGTYVGTPAKRIKSQGSSRK